MKRMEQLCNDGRLYDSQGSGYLVLMPSGRVSEILKNYPGRLIKKIEEASASLAGLGEQVRFLYSHLLCRGKVEGIVPIIVITECGLAGLRKVTSLDEELKILDKLPECERKRREAQLDAIATEFP